jgi:hypothetical protein
MRPTGEHLRNEGELMIHLLGKSCGLGSFIKADVVYPDVVTGIHADAELDRKGSLGIE